MLKLSESCHNHHPSEVRMLAKFIRREFSVVPNDTITPHYLTETSQQTPFNSVSCV
jgi:hypothetical protein